MEDTASNNWRRFSNSFPELYRAILQNPPVTIREFLQIAECPDAFWRELGLSQRSKNRLMRLGLENGSVQDILDLPLARLANMEGAGSNTLREILGAVKTYSTRLSHLNAHKSDDMDKSADEPVFNPDEFPLRRYADSIALERWDEIQAELNTEEEIAILHKIREISETIGAEMVAAILQSPYSMTVLLPTLREFVQEQQESAIRRKELSALLAAIPEERRSFAVGPFLTAWTSSKKELLKNGIDGQITFSRLAEEGISYEAEAYHALKSFFLWCQVDILEKIEDILERSITNERQAVVVMQRASGRTLEEIGKPMGITRERVRQMEKKAVQAFRASGAESLLYLLSAERGGSAVLTERELKDACGTYGKVLVYLWKSMDQPKGYRFSESLGALV